MTTDWFSNLENPAFLDTLSFGGVRSAQDEEYVLLRVISTKQAEANEQQDETMTLVVSRDSFGELLNLLQEGIGWLDTTLPDTPLSEDVWHGG